MIGKHPVVMRGEHCHPGGTIDRITSGSWMQAMNRIAPPQAGRVSMPNTRLRRADSTGR